MKHLNIILLEDSAFDADLIERELKRSGISFAARVVEDKPGFEKALKEFRPDIVLSDHSMPQFNSIEAFSLLQQHQRESNALIPFILVTGEVSEEFAVQCLKAGVADYILKDRLKRLPAAIESAIEKCRIEDERLKYLREVILKEAIMTEAGHLARLGSWQADLVTGTHLWSDETYCVLGYDKGEVEPGFPAFFDRVHPDDREFLVRYHGDVMDRLEDGEVEFRIIDKNGDLKYISAKIQIHRDACGQPLRLVGFNLDITARKKTELRLQERKQEYMSLFDQNPDPVFSMDPAGTFTKVNKAMTDLTGRGSAELCRLDFRSLLHPEDLPRVDHHLLSALDRRAVRFEARFIHAQGLTLTLDVTFMPVIVRDEVIGVHGVAKDITRKRKLEEQLHQAYRFARIGGWELDFITQKIAWTDITREIHEVDDGFEPSLESGIRFYKEGKSRDAIRKAVKQCVDYGIPYDVELQIITARGNERWIRATGEAVLKDGRCTGLFGTFQDIHARKSAEETLKDAYRERIDILESIGDGFFAVDRKWVVTYWNNIAEKILRMPREQILGKNLWSVYADAIPLAFYREAHKAMLGGSPMHLEEYYAALGIWVEVNIYPSPTGLSVYFKDITEKKKHIQAIERQNEQLRAIAHIQSHQVRAPLARIIGLAGLIQEGLHHEHEFPGLLTDMLASAKELDGLIRTIVRKTEEMGAERLR